ncbi:MAG: tetratricopeptide repeat protein [Pseudohaliea sp.]
MAPAGRLLLVGWSAADWLLLEPLLAAGALPNLSRFLARGARGRLRTLQPQCQPLLWTSLATGRRADSHGVVHGTVADARGGVDPVSARDRQARALWDLVETAGGASAVVNWPLTYPLPAFRGACASDAFFLLRRGGDDALEAPPADSFRPLARGEELAGSRLSPMHFFAEEMDFFLADREAAEAEADPMLTQLALSLARNVNVHAAAMALLAADDWRLGMVRYDLLELLGPPFMACRPPQLPYLPDGRFERYRGTLDAACRYLDLLFGALLDHACTEDTAVLLVSERGMQAGDLRPQDARTAFEQRGGVPWYREHGLFAAAGPAIEAGGAVQGAGLLDVVPTALALLGVPGAADLPGRSLREMMPGVAEVAPRGSYELVPLRGAGQSLTPGERGTALVSARQQRWLDGAGDDDLGTPEDARTDRDFNLAIAALDARRPRAARGLLERVYRARPDDDRVRLHLARCLRACGDRAGAGALLEQVVDHADPRPYERIQLAQLQLAAGEHDRALANLFRAEQSEGMRPGVHLAIGRVYLALERWDEAGRAFRKALERDPESAAACLGLARVALAGSRWEDAIASALEAIDLDRARPEAHFALAEALLGQDRLPLATDVLRTCLSLDAGHREAWRALGRTCRALGEDEEAAACEQRAARLDAVREVSRQAGALRR